jgi:hypothetical protein
MWEMFTHEFYHLIIGVFAVGFAFGVVVTNII